MNELCNECLPDNETLIPLTQGRRLVPQNRVLVAPTYRQLYKWWSQGIVSKVTDKLVRLECCQEGRFLYTSVEAYRRFRARLNGKWREA
jgi:hypothetical protein